MSGIYTYGETVHMFIERKITTAIYARIRKMGIDYNPTDVVYFM
jgi:hypothetical protein